MGTASGHLALERATSRHLCSHRQAMADRRQQQPHAHRYNLLNKKAVHQTGCSPAALERATSAPTARMATGPDTFSTVSEKLVMNW